VAFCLHSMDQWLACKYNCKENIAVEIGWEDLLGKPDNNLLKNKERLILTTGTGKPGLVKLQDW
jgi:hypothetical protein